MVAVCISVHLAHPPSDGPVRRSSIAGLTAGDNYGEACECLCLLVQACQAALWTTPALSPPPPPARARRDTQELGGCPCRAVMLVRVSGCWCRQARWLRGVCQLLAPPPTPLVTPRSTLAALTCRSAGGRWAGALATVSWQDPQSPSCTHTTSHSMPAAGDIQLCL
jgi:hypothetical protein